MGLPVLTPMDFQRFRDLIYQEAGIALNDTKIDLVRGRLTKLLNQRRLQSFHDYYEVLRGDPTGAEISAFIDAISTNKTDFFREASHFEFLERELLPGLIRTKKARGDRRMRIWCAAASTGEEPYTLAIVLNRLDLLNGSAWDTKILATDISTKALDHAVHGVYSPDRTKPVPPAELRALFDRLPDGRYRAAQGLKQAIRFGRVNLLEERYPFRGPFDFIFCRNVMIYFDAPTRERIVNRMAKFLAPGGHFFIGKSESLTGLEHPYSYVMPAVYRRGN